MIFVTDIAALTCEDVWINLRLCSAVVVDAAREHASRALSLAVRTAPYRAVLLIQDAVAPRRAGCRQVRIPPYVTAHGVGVSSSQFVELGGGYGRRGGQRGPRHNIQHSVFDRGRLLRESVRTRLAEDVGEKEPGHRRREPEEEIGSHLGLGRGMRQDFAESELNVRQQLVAAFVRLLTSFRRGGRGWEEVATAASVTRAATAATAATATRV